MSGRDSRTLFEIGRFVGCLFGGYLAYVLMEILHEGHRLDFSEEWILWLVPGEMAGGLLATIVRVIIQIEALKIDRNRSETLPNGSNLVLRVPQARSTTGGPKSLAASRNKTGRMIY